MTETTNEQPKKILVSWIAYGNDFSKDSEINMEGPTKRLHCYHLEDYEKHYWLMSWAEGATENKSKEISIKNYINDYKLNDKVVPIFIELNDPVNIVEIREKLEKKLIELKLHKQEIEAFISPGTPSMMVVWYMLSASNNFRLKLFQMRRPEYSAG